MDEPRRSALATKICGAANITTVPRTVERCRRSTMTLLADYAEIEAVADESRWRFQRVAIFFYGLFALSVVGLLALDRIPPRPRLDCHHESAMVQSPYPHPYGPPPLAEWTVCEWR